MNLTLAFWLAVWIMGQEPPVQTLETPTQMRAVRTIEILLLNCSGLPCVDMATGSGKTLRLLIDTGNVNSYLDTKIAQAMGLHGESLKGSEGAAIGVVQQAVVPGSEARRSAHGRFSFYGAGHHARCDQSRSEAAAASRRRRASLFGVKNRTLQIDYGDHALRISEPQTPVGAQIDTLFTGTMLIYPSSVEKLGLKKPSKAKHKDFFPFTHDGVKLGRAERAANDQLWIGATDAGCSALFRHR